MAKAHADGTSAKTHSPAQQALHRLGLVRDIDLALHLPLRYEDETRLTPMASLRDGQAAQCEGVVRRCEVQLRPRRQLVVHLIDEAGDELLLRFVHFYPSHQKTLQVGQRVLGFEVGLLVVGFDDVSFCVRSVGFGV